MRPSEAADISGQPKPGWVSTKWKLLCVAVAIVALYFVFHRIPFATLWGIIRSMRVGFFICAIILYGIMFLPAAMRWHLALHVNDAVISPGATVCFSIIGHFFYLLLFGGAGGDAAKATVYARRYSLPIPKTLTSVSLDRLMGSGALVVVALTALAITGTHGGFAGTKSLSINKAAWLLLLLIPIIITVLILLKRSHHESVFRRFAVAFLEGGNRLIRSPKIVLKGFFCSLLMQCAINTALAMNLQAVSHTPLPWLKLVWAFPLITAVSGLPITVAGIGARDGAAIALLGWCGIAAVDAEAMSLLALCVTVFWGLVGGIVLWWESTRTRN